MALSIVIGCTIGWYLDKWFGTKPWMFLLFMVFGIAAGFRIVIKEVSKLGGDDTKEKPEGNSKPWRGN
jgi:ATP synthase protein I